MGVLEKESWRNVAGKTCLWNDLEKLLIFGLFIFVQRFHLSRLMDFCVFWLGDDQHRTNCCLEQMQAFFDLVIVPNNDLSAAMTSNNIGQTLDIN